MKITDLEFTPVSFGLPECGTECVIKINGMFGTAEWGHNYQWNNEDYVDGFHQSDVEAWLAITDLSCIPTFKP